MCEMSFHVADVMKPLAAAMSIAKMGNRIVLEDGPSKSYVENLRTGDKVMLRESGGTHVLDAECLKGSRSSTLSRRG